MTAERKGWAFGSVPRDQPVSHHPGFVLHAPLFDPTQEAAQDATRGALAVPEPLHAP